MPLETISRIATGETSNPQVGTLRRVAPALGVTVAWLIGDDESTPLTPAEAGALQSAIDVIRGRLPRDLDAQPNAVCLPRFEIPRTYARNGVSMAYQITDDSMRDAGIHAEDVLLIRPKGRRTARDLVGFVVVCSLAEELFVKRLHRLDNAALLLSDSTRYRPIVVDRDNTEHFRVVGAVVGRLGRVPSYVTYDRELLGASWRYSVGY